MTNNSERSFEAVHGDWERAKKRLESLARTPGVNPDELERARDEWRKAVKALWARM